VVVVVVGAFTGGGPEEEREVSAEVELSRVEAAGARERELYVGVAADDDVRPRLGEARGEVAWARARGVRLNFGELAVEPRGREVNVDGEAGCVDVVRRDGEEGHRSVRSSKRSERILGEGSA
jgi:hypothetical protein